MQSSLGSGVIMRPDSFVETNNHVNASPTEAIGAFTSLRTLEGKIVHTNRRTDLNDLKVGMGDEMLTVEALR